MEDERSSSDTEEAIAMDLRPDSRKGSSGSQGNGELRTQYERYPVYQQAPKRTLLKLRRKLTPLFQDLVSEGAISEESADVEFVCKDGQVVKGHRIILALSSPFFTALFHKQKPSKKSIVSIPEATPKAISNILSLCYKEQVLLDSEQDIQETVYWLQQFGFIRGNVQGVDQFWPSQDLEVEEEQEPPPSWLTYLLENSSENSMGPREFPLGKIKQETNSRPSSSTSMPSLTDMRPRTKHERKPQMQSRIGEVTYWLPSASQNLNLKSSSSQAMSNYHNDEDRWICPFCKHRLSNWYTWNQHAMNCNGNRRSHSAGTSSSSEEGLNGRRSGRQTSHPAALRDYVIHQKPADSSNKHLRKITKKPNEKLKAKSRKPAPVAGSIQKVRAYRTAETRNFRHLPKIPVECLRNAENADEQERIRWLYVCLKCQLSLDSSIKAYAHWGKCNAEVKYEDAVIKYRQGYYGRYLCPLCTRRYTTIYGFVVHCIHNHVEYKKLLSHVISEDKIMCTNCGDKFFGPQEFHVHLGPNQYCEKPPKHQLIVKRKPKKPSLTAAQSSEASVVVIPPEVLNPKVDQEDQQSPKIRSRNDSSDSSSSTVTYSSVFEQSGGGDEDIENDDNGKERRLTIYRNGSEFSEDNRDSDMVIFMPMVKRESDN